MLKVVFFLKFLFIRFQALHYNFYQVTKRSPIQGVFNPVFPVFFVLIINLPFIAQPKLSFQELEDFGAVLLILLRSISHSNGRHGHQHTRGAGPCDHHRQVSLYHQIHPLETRRRKSYDQGQGTWREKSLLSTDHCKNHNFFFLFAQLILSYLRLPVSPTLQPMQCIVFSESLLETCLQVSQFLNL